MSNTGGFFKAIGLSFKNTVLQTREQLALDEIHAKKLLQFIRDYTSATDALVLSTCNRTEIYYNNETDLKHDILKGLAHIKGLSSEDILDCFDSILDNSQAVNHLFNVSMGLEAQVVGDLQISNQVKMAYQYSADENMAGPFLHRLMHTIFFANKRVVQETAFRDGAASVSYAAKELIEDLSANVQNPKILILGIGEIGEDVCRNLAESKFNDITVTNRTHSKAVDIAEECNFKVVDFKNALEAIADSDVIVSSLMTDKPFITKEFAQNLEINSFKFFIDLSVPRSIDTAIEEVNGALLYNIDNIQSKTSQALEKRIAAIPSVEKIIKESLTDFEDWSKEMIVSPTIKKLKNALEDIRKQELTRYLKDANEEQAKMLDSATKSMMQKIMKLPVLQLKAACKRGEAETLIDVLNDLFDLEKQPNDQ